MTATSFGFNTLDTETYALERLVLLWLKCGWVFEAKYQLPVCN